MNTYKFKCTLLSDIIINQKSSTEGNQETLDFIPGGNFLGIVASSLYNNISKEEAILIFHSGKVRFSDAHPAYNNTRSLRIPASLFYPKLDSIYTECYIHHNISNETLKSDDFKSKNLKQCRTGFFAFNNKTAQEVKIEKTFSIKSKYDRNKRRSEDEILFGYQSIDKGYEFYFSVESDLGNNKLEENIKKALIGTKRIGRSKTAQYGLVEIKEDNFNESNSSKSTTNKITIYADGRLIFLDEKGTCSFQPTIEQLGIKKGKILWSESQIRTFQYSPWNFKRQCYDTDRCGIEKGSVFVVETEETPTNNYIGSYNNEGFGKVIYNPDFLNSKDNSGLSVYKFTKLENNSVDSNIAKQLNAPKNDDLLLNYLYNCKKQEDITQEIYKIVNEFVEKYGKKFTKEGNLFASQWGNIRSIAMKNNTKEELSNKLFGKNDKEGYLTHGVAAEKWNENSRIKVFKEFFEKLDDNNSQLAIINLASEMAKKCRR